MGSSSDFCGASSDCVFGDFIPLGKDRKWVTHSWAGTRTRNTPAVPVLIPWGHHQSLEKAQSRYALFQSSKGSKTHLQSFQIPSPITPSPPPQKKGKRTTDNQQTTTAQQCCKNGLAYRNLHAQLQKPNNFFIKQNYMWSEVKMNIADFLYSHIYSTKIKRGLYLGI